MDSIARKEKRRNYKPTDSCIVCAGRQGRRKEGMPHGMFKRVKNKLRQKHISVTTNRESNNFQKNIKNRNIDCHPVTKQTMVYTNDKSPDSKSHLFVLERMAAHINMWGRNKVRPSSFRDL